MVLLPFLLLGRACSPPLWPRTPSPSLPSPAYWIDAPAQQRSFCGGVRSCRAIFRAVRGAAISYPGRRQEVSGEQSPCRKGDARREPGRPFPASCCPAQQVAAEPPRVGPEGRPPRRSGASAVPTTPVAERPACSAFLCPVASPRPVFAISCRIDILPGVIVFCVVAQLPQIQWATGGPPGRTPPGTVVALRRAWATGRGPHDTRGP